MKICGIIAEYNPLHTGHAYHLERARHDTDCDLLLVAMSGNFVQRGERAVAEKHLRAEWAISCGADAVLEIPQLFALSTAENFALGGLKTLSYFSDLTLSFGSECGDIDRLRRLATLLGEENLPFKQLLREKLKQGKSFPRARGEAFSELYPELASEVSKPNNILAIEYLNAAAKLGLNIRFHTIEREDNYSSELPSERFASATAIRAMAVAGEPMRKYLPDCVDFHARSEENFGRAIMENLRSMEKTELAKIAEVKEGLENRIKKYADLEYAAFLEAVKTKRYTMAKLKRISILAALGITAEQVEIAKTAEFAPHVLASNEKFCEYAATLSLPPETDGIIEQRSTALWSV